MLALFVTLLLATQTASKLEIGYVVDRPIPAGWTASGPNGTRRLDVGTGILPAETLTAPAGAPSDATVAVLLFSTGRVVRIPSGGKVDDAQPARAGTLERLWSAIRRRLNNETLRSGLVRSGNVLSDGIVRPGDDGVWRTLSPGVTEADYTVRVRPLGPDGEPKGDWGESAPMADVRFSSIGLWQVSVRHRRVPSVSGDAWVLVTRNAESARSYEQFAGAIAKSLEIEGAELATTASTLRRAALLSLAADVK